jgi:peroxiredoxin
MTKREPNPPHGPEPRLEDDGACEHLVGVNLPSLQLGSTQGPVDLAGLAENLLVLFIYPHATGLPDAPVPGWDAIPGALGCNAQSCGFRDAHDRLTDVGATLAGLSVQEVHEQATFAARVGLRYRLISDPMLELGAAVGLPTFTASGRTFYKRVTLLALRGRIVKVFYPIDEPALNGLDVLEWLEGQAPPTEESAL